MDHIKQLSGPRVTQSLPLAILTVQFHFFRPKFHQQQFFWGNFQQLDLRSCLRLNWRLRVSGQFHIPGFKCKNKWHYDKNLSHRLQFNQELKVFWNWGNLVPKVWPFGVALQASLAAREVLDSIPGEVKTDTVSPTTRHRCDVFVLPRS